MKKDYYLQSIDLEKANSIIDDLVADLFQASSESISVYDSLNRVTFDSVYAKVSSPSYNASAMDGIASKSILTHEASDANPITIKKEDFIQVNTGNVIPLEFDTVIMIENVMWDEDNNAVIIKSHGLFENVRPIGEDIVKGEMIVPKNNLITPTHISALLSGGITEVKVMKKPTIAIIPTGDEIVQSKTDIQPGEIIDSNSYFMLNELSLLGVEGTILPRVKDVYEELESTLVKASKEYDFVIVGAGSSAGTKDYTSSVIEKNGKLYVHGISIKPGKPTIIGTVNNTIIIGIPGYPVSTYISFNLIVKRMLKKAMKQPLPNYQKVKAKLSKKVYSSLKNKEYIRVQLGTVNDELIATPLSRGAGITMSLVKSDGFLIVDRFSEGFEAKETVEITLTNETNDHSKTLVSIGSHDIILDIINDQLNENGFKLSSSHVGSFGGVLSIKNMEAHISPVHILCDSGNYNDTLIDEFLDDEYVVVRGVTRQQCLYVKKGNPKNISSLKDLKRSDISFVNRQKGSGTRILFDFLIQKLDINHKEISGYEYELSTHTQVASTVLTERYDVGLGIVSVANMYDLDYIPVGEEHYDFLVHKSTLQLESFKSFIQIIQSKYFKEKIEYLGGYSLDNPGTIK